MQGNMFLQYASYLFFWDFVKPFYYHEGIISIIPA